MLGGLFKVVSRNELIDWRKYLIEFAKKEVHLGKN
jgi:hypothetical protein